MTMKSKTAVGALAVALSFACAREACGAGFGLYEMSAAAMVNGGHRTAKAVDASAVYYNPATMRELEGTWVTAGNTFILTRLDTRVNGVGAHKMNPGWFMDPHAFVTHAFTDDFSAGLGSYADFGLGSHYDNSWPVAWDSVDTMVAAYSVSPTFSYRITDKWSVGGGVRFTYATFEQRRIFRMAELLSPMGRAAYGMIGRNPNGTMRVRYTAHNDVDVGYLLGTVYDVTDDFSLAAVWRSRERVRFAGKCQADGDSGLEGQFRGKFEEKLDLPSSATVGYHWNRAFGCDPLRFAGSLVWTEWSTIDQIDFGSQGMELGWHNAYRAGFGFEYDVCDAFTAGVGYVYDWDPSREKRPNTMLPCGDRHNVYFGGTCHLTENLDFSAMVGMVIMEAKTHWFDNPLKGTALDALAAQDRFKYQARNSHTYLVTFTLTYHF